MMPSVEVLRTFTDINKTGDKYEWKSGSVPVSDNEELSAAIVDLWSEPIVASSFNGVTTQSDRRDVLEGYVGKVLQAKDGNNMLVLEVDGDSIWVASNGSISRYDNLANNENFLELRETLVTK